MPEQPEKGTELKAEQEEEPPKKKRMMGHYKVTYTLINKFEQNKMWQHLDV